MANDSFEAMVAADDQRRRRTIVRHTVDLEAATVTVTLGCGHTLPFRMADHPVVAIHPIGLEPGDEMDCPHCARLVH